MLAPGVETAFDRDTAVRRLASETAQAQQGGEVQTITATAGAVFAAEVSPEWRAGRGPHGGYLAAMILRAMVDTVAEPERAPRSLTIHYARAPEPGPVQIATTIERGGRSLSTLSARLEQDGRLMALALAAFSPAWEAPALADPEPMPQVKPPDPVRETPEWALRVSPPFARHLVTQGRIGGMPFQGSDLPMEVGAWLGTAEPRPLDALALALFSDALFSPPFLRMSEPAFTPTIDLTIHFREALPRAPEPDPEELVFARFRSSLVHEGFFEEDGVIWAPDGAVLAHSRQLGIVMPIKPR